MDFPSRLLFIATNICSTLLFIPIVRSLEWILDLGLTLLNCKCQIFSGGFKSYAINNIRLIKSSDTM